MEKREAVGGSLEAKTNGETEWTISGLLPLLHETHTNSLPKSISKAHHHAVTERMKEQGGVGRLESHLGEAGQVGNATSVVLIPSHEDIAFVSPVFSPAVEPIKTNTYYPQVFMYENTEYRARN